MVDLALRGVAPLVVPSTIALPVGLGAGLSFGLAAWLYHHWIRRRLAAQGLLPARLPESLSWCSEDARGWLRVSDAYEFRHRELLEHLARTATTGTRPAR